MTTFNTTAAAFTAALGEGTQTPCVRAFALLKSRRRLDILNPDPEAWADDDLAGAFPGRCDGVASPNGLTPSPLRSTA